MWSIQSHVGTPSRSTHSIQTFFHLDASNLLCIRSHSQLTSLTRAYPRD